MRLIDADVLIEEFKTRAIKARQWKESAILANNDEAITRADATLAFLTEVKLTIEKAPTVEERPKGKWISREAKCNTSFPFWERYECPFCHKYSGYSSFCQHCGADMREGQTDD